MAKDKTNKSFKTQQRVGHKTNKSPKTQQRA